MKTIILFAFLMMVFPFVGHAQNSDYKIIGSEEYGRIFDLTYDQNIENRVYALTLGNHLLKSDDNGKNWEILHAFTFDIDGLKFLDTENALSFYSKNLRTAELFVFDLDANSISKVIQLPPQQADSEWIDGYDFFSDDPDIAIVMQNYKIGIANFQKIQYTKTGGDQWEEVYHTVNHDNVFINLVAISPDNPEKLFLARSVGDSGVYGGLWISENGGATWTENLPGTTFNPIAFHPENSNEIWIGSGISAGSGQEEGLYKSTNGGTDWELISLNWTSYIMDCINVIGINPGNPNHIVVLEENEVAVSYDGGENWELFVYPGYDEIDEYSYGLNLSFNPFHEEELWVSANYFPMFSADSGESLLRQKTPFFVGEGNVRLTVNEGENHLYYGVQFGYVHRDLQTMEEQDFDILPLNYVTINSSTVLFVDPNIPGRVYTFSGGFMGHELKVSDDHGENTTSLYSTFLGECTAVMPFPNNPDKIWAVFSSMGNDVEIQEIDFSNPSNPEISSIAPPQSSGELLNIYFDPNNPQNVLLSQSGVMYRSSDGGNQWEESNNGLEILNPNSDVIVKLVENPLDENQLTIATSKGVFTTFDSGLQWELLSAMPAHNIKHSSISENQLVAVTHRSEISDFGIFLSVDYGENWEEIDPEDLLFLKSGHVLRSSAIYFEDEETAIVYVSSVGLGLVQFTIDLQSLEIEDVEIISNEPLILYPNPTTEFLNIKNRNTFDTYEIFDLQGKRLMYGKIKESLDVSHLDSGVYLIRVQGQNTTSQTGKFIKN